MAKRADHGGWKHAEETRSLVWRIWRIMWDKGRVAPWWKSLCPQMIRFLAQMVATDPGKKYAMIWGILSSIAAERSLR